MELKTYFDILVRRKFIIVITVLAALVAVVIGIWLQTPMYQATVTLRVSVSSSGSLSYSSTSYALQLLNTTAKIATSGIVKAELLERLNMTREPEITAQVVSNTELIELSVEDENPYTAARAASTLAEILIAQSNQVYAGGGISAQQVLGEQLAAAEKELDLAREDYENELMKPTPSPEMVDVLYQTLLLKQRSYETLLTQYQESIYEQEMRSNMITVVENPEIPTSPSKPRVLYTLVLGLAAGLFGGVFLAFATEAFDTTLYTSDDIENAAEMEPLARIPRAKGGQLKLSSTEDTPFAESFRDLSMKIQRLDRQSPMKVIVVFSAEPSEGKSIVVSHLALRLAESCKKVVVVDCDLRRPKLHTWFGLDNSIGLKEVLVGSADLFAALQQTAYEGLSVLTSGVWVERPTLLFGTPQMEEIIATLRNEFDYVLLDTPAFLAVGDVSVISEYADGLLLVACREVTRRGPLQAAASFVKKLQNKTVGLIINQDAANYGTYYYHRMKGL